VPGGQGAGAGHQLTPGSAQRVEVVCGQATKRGPVTGSKGITLRAQIRYRAQKPGKVQGGPVWGQGKGAKVMNE